jgi:hypothetical protein
MKPAQEEKSRPWVPKEASPGSCNNLQLSMIEWRLDYLQLNFGRVQRPPCSHHTLLLLQLIVQAYSFNRASEAVKFFIPWHSVAEQQQQSSCLFLLL